ncbi:MAG: cell division protein FtsQ/DivIB [Bacteroidetes bacterium]|nr:cell division protein FtsQ/DivIB [Bacteroidota bacterium]
MHWSGKHHNQPASMGRRIQPKEDPKAASQKSSKGNPLSGFNPGKLLPVAIIMLLLGTAALAGWYFKSDTVIQSVNVTGNYFTEASEIIAIAGIPLQSPPDSVSFLAVLQRIETLPYIKTAGMRLASRGAVQISVQERTPIGMFIQGNRRVFTDEQGVILPVRPGKAVDVPLVYGIGISARQDTLRSAAFQQVRDFLIEAQRVPLAFATLSEIAWTADEGIVALSHENGIRLVFGRDRYAESLRNWDLFYRQVVAVRGPQQFTSVDLRYNGQIVTRES